jgi:serine/threonine protein phosphatase 1
MAVDEDDPHNVVQHEDCNRPDVTLAQGKWPGAPKGVTIYALGDIHGRLDLLEKVHRRIDADKSICGHKRVAEIYVGDYIDRGPDTAGVISRLIARSRETYTVFLRGNHEQLLLDFVDGTPCLKAWKAVGAIASLLSYGLPSELLSKEPSDTEIRHALASRLPTEHLNFISQTAPYCESGRYLFVHAGLRPGIKLGEQATKDILGIRGPFLEFQRDYGWIVVHGHTPVLEPDFRSNRINIDTGAYATNRLTCLKITENGPRILHSPSEMTGGR